MGRYLGIAWETGDHFTFKLWSEPNGDCTKGREYIQTSFAIGTKVRSMTLRWNCQILLNLNSKRKRRSRSESVGMTKDFFYVIYLT